MATNSVNSWDYRLSLESKSLKQFGKVLSHRYFSASLLYAVKTWAPNKIFYSPSERSSQIQRSLCQKFYGKKIAFLSSKRDITRVMNLCRTLKEVVMDEMKIDKMKSQNDLVVYGEVMNFTKQEIKKILRGFQGRLEISDWGEFNLSKAIPALMSDVKQLHLDIFNLEDFHVRKGTFSKLKGLQKLYLYFENGNTGEEEESLNQTLSLNALQDIVKSKNLKVLTLEFGIAKINHETLCHLLKLLSNSNIESWYLNVCLTVDDFHWIDEMKPFLTSVDSLALDSECLGKFEGELAKGHDCPFLPRYENRDQGIKRILRILYEQGVNEDEDEDEGWGEDPSKTVDISKYLAYCTGLKSLFVKSVGGKLGAPGQINFPASLTSVTICFNNIYCPGYRNCDQNVLRSLLASLEKMKSLLSLRLFQARSDFHMPTSMDEESKSEEIIFLAEEIKRIAKVNLLGEIQIFDSGVVVNPIRETLQSMNSLKKLDFVLTGASVRKKYWDGEFPFELILNLEEVRISINYDVEFLHVWGFGLIKSLKEMKNLRVFEIMDNTKKGLKLEVVYGVLSSLSCVEKLEKLYIQTLIIKDPESEMLSQLLSEEAREIIFNAKDRIFQDIRNAIQKMRKKCEKLEEIKIGRFSSFPFERIRYNKYLLKDEYLNCSLDEE